jgi:hypothetical protein
MLHNIWLRMRTPNVLISFAWLDFT